MKKIRLANGLNFVELWLKQVWIIHINLILLLKKFFYNHIIYSIWRGCFYNHIIYSIWRGCFYNHIIYSLWRGCFYNHIIYSIWRGCFYNHINYSLWRGCFYNHIIYSLWRGCFSSIYCIRTQWYSNLKRQVKSDGKKTLEYVVHTLTLKLSNQNKLWKENDGHQFH
jgi:hypothetical protein